MADTKTDEVSAEDLKKQQDRQKLEADARLGSRKAQEELGWKDGSGDAEESSAPATGQEVLEAQAAADAEAQKAADAKAAEEKAAADKAAADKLAADKAAAAKQQQGQQKS